MGDGRAGADDPCYTERIAGFPSSGAAD